MKILVVDDDEGARLFLNRLLTKKFSCEIVEACNGLDGLVKTEVHKPDLVMIDIHMPVMGGVEMLESLRKDPLYSNLPVIVMSVVDDKREITKLIQLGISDYLLKPLWSDPVFKRLGGVLARLKSVPQFEKKLQSSNTSEERRRVLVVDKDIHFRTFFESMLGGQFEVLEASTGAEGLTKVIDNRPEIVCVGEGLRFFGEQSLVQKIRGLEQNPVPRVYLFSDTKYASHRFERDKIAMPLFDGILRKTFVPEVFLNEFKKGVLGERSVSEALRDIIQTHLRAEMVSAAQQTIGVMTLQEVFALDEAEFENVSRDVCTSVDLIGDEQKFVLTVVIYGSGTDVESIAQKILGTPTSLQDGAADAFAELSNVIGGRICTSIEARGIRVQQKSPVVSFAQSASQGKSWELAIPFRTAAGEMYGVGLCLSAN